MAEDDVQAPGNLHFDDLNKLRVLPSDVIDETTSLRDECKGFVEHFEEYQKLVSKFTDLMRDLSKEVEAQKMKAVGSCNLLKTMRKQRDTQQQKLKELIVEKTLQLERCKVEADELQRQEEEQRDFVEQFASSKMT